MKKTKSSKRLKIVAFSSAIGIFLGSLFMHPYSALMGACVGPIVGLIASLFQWNITLGADPVAVHEDLRKIGLTIAGAALLGIIIGPEKMSFTTSLPLLASGYMLWFVGIYSPEDKK